MGMICTSIMNAVLMVHSDPKKKIKWYTPNDFIPDHLGIKEEEINEEEKPKQTPEEMKNILMALTGVKG